MPEALEVDCLVDSTLTQTMRSGFGHRIRSPEGRDEHMADLVQYYGTGRRKSAIARVFLRPGTGEFKVNGKGYTEYFVTEQQRVAAKRSLVLTEIALDL